MTDDPRPQTFNTGKVEEPPAPEKERIGPEVWRPDGKGGELPETPPPPGAEDGTPAT